ncbi:MAG: hypothetical protein LYZ66_07095 [Nitrososphaerales archaeon]|nr:hypothetical protein [Nitrososphaerales archaeon]
MEYEGYERLKRVRGFTLGLFGSFIFAFSSVVVTVRQQPNYLTLGVLSVSSLGLAYFALRTSTNARRFTFLIATGGTLAAEASAVMLYFFAVDAFIYTLATLIGSWLALKGVMDMESLKVDDYYWKKKKEAARELTV